jgi:hypothetical protein
MQKKVRPTISLPLERPDYIDETQPLATRNRGPATVGWKSVDSIPFTPASSVSSAHRSYVSSPASSRSSSSSRTSYESSDAYFPRSEKKVSFSTDTTIIPRKRDSSASVASSVYAAEGELPPAIEYDEEILRKIGKYRFVAADYIREIEGTPMILVDGKLYL